MSDLELPGRYDGVLVSDLAHRVEMEAMGIASWRAANDAAPTVDTEARLRAVATTSPQAAAAFGLLNAGSPVIVPIDERGIPLTQPARDPDLLASWWEPGGSYVDKWPATPCGSEGGYFGLLVSGEGMDWFKKIATVHQPTRVERLLAVFDRVTEMGVPPSGGGDGWDDDDSQPPKPDSFLPTVHSTLFMCEDLPQHRAVTRSWMGSLRGAAGQAAMAAGRPPEARQISAMVWSWPPGQTLPVGRELRKGVESLPAIPAHGAVINVGGVSLVVRSVMGLVSPLPTWLISAIQELA